MRHEQLVTVAFDYPIHFCSDLLADDDASLVDAVTRREPGRRHRVDVVIDDGVSGGHPDLVERLTRYFSRHAHSLELVAAPDIIPGGEQVKNERAHFDRALARMHDLGLDRQSVVVAIGGGAVLDMVGFAAAITHRGVRVVRVPTTVLAQADSGVGVKNGINAFGKKNYLGAFVAPYAVLNDARLLRSLSHRDRIAGMAEAVKVALVRDGGFYAWLVEHAAALGAGEEPVIGELIRRSCLLHAQHIASSGDAFELGSARPLDYGHWSAHKLEALTRHRLRHGEAVAIGMALDALYSEHIGLARAGLAESICAVLEALGFTLWDDALEGPELLRGLDEFREHIGGELTLTLVRAPGVGVEVHEVDIQALSRCVELLRKRGRA